MPRRQGSNQSAAERWAFGVALSAAIGTVLLLFWALTAGMNQSSCRENIAGNPDCNNNGPSARILLGWAVLAALVFAVALVARRRFRRERLVRAGMNFVPSTNERVLLGAKLLRWSGWSCWSAGVAVFLALVISGAGAALGVAAFALALTALALWARGLRLKRR